MCKEFDTRKLKYKKKKFFRSAPANHNSNAPLETTMWPGHFSTVFLLTIWLFCVLFCIFFLYFSNQAQSEMLLLSWNGLEIAASIYAHTLFIVFFVCFFFFLVFIRFQLWSYGRYLDHSPQAMNKIGMAIIIMRMSDAYENSYNYLQVNWFTYLLATIHT